MVANVQDISVTLPYGEWLVGGASLKVVGADQTHIPLLTAVTTRGLLLRACGSADQKHRAQQANPDAGPWLERLAGSVLLSFVP